MRVTSGSAAAFLLNLAAGGIVLVGTIAPLSAILAHGLLAPPRPSGFGHDSGTLLSLAQRSLVLALVPAALATLLAISASCISHFHRRFRIFYRSWIYTCLFTNPVFLVLGMTVLLNRLPATLAVILAGWLVIMPLVALPIQAAMEQAPRGELLAARALGASAGRLVRLHLIPAVAATAVGAFWLASVFGLGFYLLPTFVGYGQTPTLGAAIDTAFNRLGDADAAAQLGILLVVLELLLGGVLALLAFVIVRRKGAGA